ncbi:MAG: hypothetical protein KAI94_10120 [Anaerolineales bacterium]|nr:hypothetical protein [Anaerolineales bacterium]
MECLGDAARAPKELSALMLFHRIAVEIVQAQKENSIVYNAALGEHEIASSRSNDLTNLPGMFSAER